MGFALPLALLGLAAGLLPLIAHRVRRRDLPHQPLPTLRLLQRAMAAQRAKRSFADLVLLALRIAVVILACLAVASPYVTSHVAFGDGEVASASVVVDDSLSMMRTEDGTTLLTRAVERATEAISALPPGSEVSVVLGGAPARVLVPRTGDLTAAARALSELPDVSHRGGDLLTAARLGLQQVAAGRHARRHLLLLSDFTAAAALDATALQLAGTRLQVEKLGGDDAAVANIAIEAANAAPDPTSPGKTSVAFELRSYGPAPESVRVRAGDSEPVTVTLTAGAGRGTLKVDTPGPDDDPVVELQLMHADGLQEDNRRPLLLDGRRGLDVLLVNGDPHPTSADDELWYAKRALRLAPEAGTPLRVASTDVEGLRNLDLSGVDVAVLANVEAVSGPMTGRLEAFVRGGGGLVIFAGDHVKPQRYNARLRALLPAHIAGVEHNADVGFEQSPDAESPLKRGVGLQKTRVRTRLLLETRSPAALRFADGLPALVHDALGRGRVALLATAIDDDWSDLPYRPGFVPLLVEAVRAVAQGQADRVTPRAPGQRVQLPVPPGTTRMEVVTPQGFRHAFDNLPGDGEVQLEDTLAAGAYRVFIAGPDAPLRLARAQTFVIELPAEESDLRAGPLPKGDADGDGVQPGGGRVVRRDVAPYGFALVGLLVVAEALMRRRRTQTALAAG